MGVLYSSSIFTTAVPVCATRWVSIIFSGGLGGCSLLYRSILHVTTQSRLLRSYSIPRSVVVLIFVLPAFWECCLLVVALDLCTGTYEYSSSVFLMTQFYLNMCLLTCRAVHISPPWVGVDHQRSREKLLLLYEYDNAAVYKPVHIYHVHMIHTRTVVSIVMQQQLWHVRVQKRTNKLTLLYSSTSITVIS